MFLKTPLSWEQVLAEAVGGALKTCLGKLLDFLSLKRCQLLSDLREGFLRGNVALLHQFVRQLKVTG
jgi:hypothetical protein